LSVPADSRGWSCCVDPALWRQSIHQEDGGVESSNAANTAPSLGQSIVQPEKNIHRPVYTQAFGRVTGENASTDLVDLSGDVQRELSQFVGPNLSGIDKVAVSF
jgi:hypothetical protein